MAEINLTIVYGDVNLPKDVLELAATAIQVESGIDPDGVFFRSKRGHNWVYGTSFADAGKVWEALMNFNDEVASRDKLDHYGVTGNYAMSCINHRHIQEGIECCSSLDDCVVVEQGIYDFYHEDVKIEAWYITQVPVDSQI